MTKRDRLLESIAKTITDYRAGEIATPTPEHVETWVRQFDTAVQIGVLEELDHVLDSTYIPKATVDEFLSRLLTNKKIAGDDPCSFWKNVAFLDIQGGGNSQREMLEILSAALRKQCGIKLRRSGRGCEVFAYVDDAVFSGNRVRNDLGSWVQSDAPHDTQVHIITIALHRGGQYYAKNQIEKAATAAGKNIKLTWWRCIEIEDRKTYVNSSDVLRPTDLPDDPLIQEYVAGLKYPPVLRKPGSIGENKFFSSEEGRTLLEQEFLKAGVKIRSECPYLNVYQRPLGNMVLETLGFGSLLVTFRNCPNNCPLAFWAGDPWYPLFPRKTN